MVTPLFNAPCSMRHTHYTLCMINLSKILILNFSYYIRADPRKKVLASINESKIDLTFSASRSGVLVTIFHISPPKRLHYLGALPGISNLTPKSGKGNSGIRCVIPDVHRVLHTTTMPFWKNGECQIFRPRSNFFALSVSKG